MDYLLAQILLFLILAAIVGFLIGWITRGSGFESRMLASENQWRSRQHVLQSENNRLQAELNELKQVGMAPQQIIPQQAEAALPFRSRQDTQPAAEASSDQNHPLERLRTEINQIQKDQSGNTQQVEAVVTTIETSSSNARPTILNDSDDDADNLQVIKGIGPKIEATLNELGIFQYRQIASFTEDNINWVNEHLRFKGRIEREDWISQAKDLISHPRT